MFQRILNIVFCIIFLNNLKVSAQEEKTVHNSPIPSFEVYDLCWGSLTTFKNLSAAADTYTWNIYDKDTAGNFNNQIYYSTAIDIAFKFTHKGDYKVLLTADNGHTTAVAYFVTVDTITKANFNYQACQGRFINLSRCANSFVWYYGDSLNQTSTKHSPGHYYTAYATYTPSLKAIQGNITDSLRKIVWAIPNFLTGKFTHEVKGDTVFFHAKDSAATNILDYYWTWGDANKELIVGSEGRNVFHKYERYRDDIDYTAFLLVRNACNSAYSFASFTIGGSEIVNGTKIYPNPPEFGIVHVTTDRKADLSSVKVVNAFGMAMKEFVAIDTKKGFDLDLSYLPLGVYSITMNFSNGDVITRKVVTGD